MRPPSNIWTAGGYRWVVLGVGVTVQGAFSAYHQGLPAIAPLLQATFALDLVRTGVLLTAVSVGVALTLVAWGLLADRIGERIVLTAGLGGAGLALATAATVPTAGVTLGALLAAGMLGSCAMAASGRAVMAWFAARERGTALGVRQMATPVGAGLGAATLPVVALRYGLRGAFAELAFVCLLAAATSALLLRRTPVVPAPQASRRAPLRDRRIWRLALAGALLAGGQLSLVGYMVLFLTRQRGWAIAAAAAVLTAAQFGGAAARVAAGAWSDRAGGRIGPMRVLAMVGSLLLAATTVLVDAPDALLVPVLLATTVISMSSNGLGFTAAGEIAGVARAGTAMGLQNTVLYVAGAAVPITFGAIAAAAGWRSGFGFLALLALGGWHILAPLRPQERAGWQPAELAPPA